MQDVELSIWMESRPLEKTKQNDDDDDNSQQFTFKGYGNSYHMSVTSRKDPYAGCR